MPKRKSLKRGVKAGREKHAKAQPYAVFISHSSSDSWIANQIRKELEALGVEVWLDTMKLLGGDNIREEIVKGITRCREAIVLATPRSIESTWVAVEIGILFEQHKRITPILCYAPPDGIKMLSEAKAIDLNDFDDFLTQLQQRIEQ
jgi:hypothetical protein